MNLNLLTFADYPTIGDSNMEFVFENIGTVRHAAIQVGGLTVITGLNDTGKSFISKSIYSIIQTNKEATEQSILSKSQPIQDFFQRLRSIEQTSLAQYPNTGQPLPRPGFNSTELFTKISQSLKNRGLIEQVKMELDSYREYIKSNLASSPHPVVKQQAPQHSKAIDDSVSRIKSIMESASDPKKDNIDFFNKVIIQQLFKGQLNSISNPGSICDITVRADNQNVVHLSVESNTINDFEGTVNNYFSDAILIESPITLQLVTFIINGLAFGGPLMPTMNLYQPRIAGLPLHFYDLIKKIVNNVGNTPSEEHQDVINKVKEIIGGKIYYDQVTRSIQFDKEDIGVVRDYNIASGIKSFGMLGLLLSENILTKKTLLIIDEPEVHLHPKWEVKYAEIIIELCKAGIPIVISSHSPYLIEALLDLSKQNGFENKTRFYYGEETERGLTTFTETTNLDPIFQVLAEPMQRF